MDNKLYGGVEIDEHEQLNMKLFYHIDSLSYV